METKLEMKLNHVLVFTVHLEFNIANKNSMIQKGVYIVNINDIIWVFGKYF